jgi:hypothetical protein
MKRLTLLVGFLVALVFLGAVSAPTVSAQALDNVWLKCKVSAKGYSVDSTGAYSKSNGSGTVYLHFAWTGSTYNVDVWTYTGTQWVSKVSTQQDTVHPNENFISDFGLTFWFSDTDFIDTYHTPFITYKYKDGKLSKVTYKGTGEVDGGKVNGGTKDYYGYFTISGTNVAQDKLPFNPVI